MKIKEKLEILRNYYLATRKVGYTTLIKEGLKNYTKDKFILSDDYDADYLECKPEEVISWYNLDSIRGHNRPLMIDNDVMIRMLSEVLEEMN